MNSIVIEDIYLNLDSASNSQSNRIDNPTSTTFNPIYIDGNAANGSGQNYIAYCFHSVAGYSKLGSYSGTGSSGNAITGLGFKPAFLMIKRYGGGANSWVVQVKGLNAAAHLNETVAFTSSYSTYFNSTHATTDVFAVGTGSGGSNVSAADHIAYCFSNVKGHQKAGYYVGNGDSNGAFVYCGFKPNFVIIKNTAATAQWQMRDGKRGYNGAIKTLYTDSTEVETSGDTIDLVSNGFKIRNNSAAHNTASTNYAFLAIAEAPIVASNGDPITAR